MKIVFRSYTNTVEEIRLGYKLGFNAVNDADVISVTANLNGFTPFNAVLHNLKYDKQIFREMVEDCQINEVVNLYSGNKPNIILVPSIRSKENKKFSIEYYITKILQICNANNFKSLHFSHFGFINGNFQQEDILRILMVLLNPLINSTLKVFYWEIDSRYLDRILQCFYYINNSCYCNFNRKPLVIQLTAYEYDDFLAFSDGLYWKDLNSMRKSKLR